MASGQLFCAVANRPAFMVLTAPRVDAAGTRLPLNASSFIYYIEHSRNVVGYTEGGTCSIGRVNYHAIVNSPDATAPQDLAATATIDNSAIFGFQPVGCAGCAQTGFPLPCQTEFDACQVATTRADGFTRTAAGMDIVYPPVSTRGHLRVA